MLLAPEYLFVDLTLGGRFGTRGFAWAEFLAISGSCGVGIIYFRWVVWWFWWFLVCLVGFGFRWFWASLVPAGGLGLGFGVDWLLWCWWVCGLFSVLVG